MASPGLDHAAGALIQRNLYNPSDRWTVPLPGALTDLPSEQTTYTRDALGRVTAVHLGQADPVTGALDTQNIASFHYWTDTSKISWRESLNPETQSVSWSVPIYATTDELADGNAPDESTPPTLKREYLAGGMDQILAECTPGTGATFSIMHPIQDGSRNVFMTVRGTLGQGAQIAERTIYSAFGERNVLERIDSNPFTSQWAPRGFGPRNVGGPRPDGLTEPRSNWGALQNQNGTPADPNGTLPFGFQGRRHDDLPGVENFRNRLYDPHLGRFLEQDPHGNGPNPYSFCANDPVNSMDPMGMDEIRTYGKSLYWFSDNENIDERNKIQQSTYLGEDSGRADRVNIADAMGGGRITLSALKSHSWYVHDATVSDIKDILKLYKEPEYEAKDSNTFGVFMDGTNNDFYSGTNISMMYSAYKGSKHYYGGVGNSVDYSILDDSVRVAPLPGATVNPGSAFGDYYEDIITRACDDVFSHSKTYYTDQLHQTSDLDFIGFSRGAATCVMLADRMQQGNSKLSIRFMGLFDPVYSFGPEGSDARGRYIGQKCPFVESDSDSEKGHYVSTNMPTNVKYAAVVYAQHEERAWFPATFFHNNSKTIIQTAVSPGVHSDVGGFYSNNHYFMMLARSWILDQSKKAGVTEWRTITDSKIDPTDRCARGYDPGTVHGVDNDAPRDLSLIRQATDPALVKSLTGKRPDQWGNGDLSK